MFSGPSMFVRTASKGKYSHVGTCFNAAVLKTISAFRRTAATEWESRTSPMRNSSFCWKLRYMISSVAAVLCWYSMRMKCCLASSREKTMIFAGSPARPERNRRTRVFPSDPVPPMMRMRLPSKHFIFECPPLLVRSLVIRQPCHECGPSRAHIPGRAAEFLSVHAPVTRVLVVRNDLYVQFVCVTQQRQKLKLR